MHTKNPALIRLVASRYSEMKGLRTLGDTGFLLIGAAGLRIGIWADTHNSSFAPPLVAAIVLWAAYIVLWMGVLRARVEKYYDARFGRVGPRTIVPVSWVLVPAMGLGWTTIFIDVQVPLPFPIVTVVLSVAIWPAWIARRDFPYRAAWGLVAVAAVLAALQLPGDASLRYVWRVDATSEVGLAMACAGLCDHLILVRALKRGAAEAGMVSDRA